MERGDLEASPPEAPRAAANGGAAAAGGAASFDANVVIILAALFFALLLAVGLNSLARCALRCGGAGASAGGIKRRALRSIPVEAYGGGAEGDDVCAVCLGEFAGGDRVRVLPRCGHGFHAPCVDAWLLSRGSCPTCRRPVVGAAGGKAASKGGGGGGGAGQSRRRQDSDTVDVVIA